MEELWIGSSALILFVILLRAVMGRKISARMRYALWLIVALRLALPFALPGSPVSIMNYVPSMQILFSGETEPQKSAGAWNIENIPVGENGAENGLLKGAQGEPVMWVRLQDGTSVSLSDQEQDVRYPAFIRKTVSDSPDIVHLQGTLHFQDIVQTQEEQHSQNASQTQNGFMQRGGAMLPGVEALKISLYAVWVIGAVLMGLYLLMINMMLYRRLRGTRVLISSAVRTEEGRKLPVYRCAKLTSPCLFGVWHPAVYLNDAALADEKTRTFALTHEQQHYRHKDHIWSLVRLICLMVYWFHPLVWVAAILSIRDCELACDEGVTARITEEECAEYGRCLLSQVPLKRREMYWTASTTMSGNARALKRRLLAITHKKKSSVRAVLLTVAMLLLIAGCTFTGADDGSFDVQNDIDSLTAKEGEDHADMDGAVIGNAETDQADVGGSNTHAERAGMEETVANVSPDAALLAQLEESIRIDENGRLVFTIPENDHSPADWSICVYSREYMRETQTQLVYAAAGVGGETWKIAEAEDVLSTIFQMSMEIVLSSGVDGDEQTQTTRTIDLVERCKELMDPAAGENIMQTKLKACMLFPDGRHGWALTEDDQILYTNEGMEGFSWLGNLPYANANDTGDGHARFLAGTEAQVSSSFLDESTAYFVGFSADEGEAVLIREVITWEPPAGSENRRAHVTQRSTRIPLKEYFPNGSIYVSFADWEHGYLLVCSDPAAGQMTKHLYCTTDGGNSFSFAADLSSIISGYPTGMAFCSEDFGYIGVSHRGELRYLYGTADGGETWESLDLPVHADAIYADGLEPVRFYADGREQIAVVLKNIGEEMRYVLYQNHGAAEHLITWQLIRILPYENIRSYCIVDEETGYFVDGSGMLHEWKYEFP